MPQLFDLSNWTEQRWWNTGGTRNKKIYLSPIDGQLYYFKESLKKENKDYVYEFWSEIIASEIGLLCGFDILPYHIAVRGTVAGCLSKSMIDPDKEELSVIGQYISAFDNTFNPTDKKLRHQYDFEIIAGTLETFGLEKYFKDLVEVIVFDALIGNSDRHQENLAFITHHSALSRSISDMESDMRKVNFEKASKLVKKFLSFYIDEKSKTTLPELTKIKLLMAKSTRFSPIYDSGCSFGGDSA